MVSGPAGQEWYERWADRDRSPAEHTLTGAYRLLTVLMPVSIAAALLLPENRLVQQFAPNAATGGEEPVAWVHRLGSEIEAATAQLNRVVLSYSSVLDPAYTEAVDEIIDHPFARYIEHLAHVHTPQKAQWRTSMNLNRGHREDYFQHLVATVHLHNSLAAEAATVRSRGRAPRTGTLGMELSRDHDLHVTTEFGKAWRSAAPRQGSLCDAAEQA